jgi:deoxyribodipyrimidine photo-lyase
MTQALTLFPPSRAAALERLQDFSPKAGQDYGEGRNYYSSANDPGAVSALSPYLRSGVVSQTEVLNAVLAHHSAKAADRFITEVLWRSYWQGWLALRPNVWDAYQTDLKRLFNEVQTQSGLRQRWEAACLGQTGIAPFDDWASELATTGYLHNHTRMWFASIWVHTLGLPWQLGADFFLRHLLDGCPASNTLGWKWVAGIQTIGKPYMATAENIAKFTDGAYPTVPGLAQTPADIPALPHPERQPLWETRRPDPSLCSALVLHEDDLNPLYAAASDISLKDNVCLIPTASQTPWQMAPHVVAFRERALADAQSRLGDRIGEAGPSVNDADTLAIWARQSGVKQLVTADAPVGPTKTVLDAYDKLTDAPPLVRIRAPLNAAAWPLATAGFFKFRKHIPDLLAGLDPNV